MAGELTTTQVFVNGEQVTSTKLNALISAASFTSSAAANTTIAVVSGKIKVGTITSSEMGALSVATAALQDGSVTTAKLIDDAVTTIKLADGNITFAKMATAAVATKSEMEVGTADKIVESEQVHNSPGVAKARGVFTIDSTSRVTTALYNVASVVKVTTTTTKVTFTSPMSSASYAVIATGSGSAVDTAISIAARTSADFTIRHPAEAGSTTAVMFCVFGTLA